jgi:PKD repeat protein
MKHEWNYGVGVLDTMKVGYKKYTAIGTYKVKLIERLGSYCADSMIDTVAVMPKPVDINIVGKATTITAQDTFTAVVAKVKSVYTWVITGGTKLSGGNSSEIVVKWNTPPLSASIKVTETDSFGCVGTQKSKSVTVQKPAGVNGLESIGIQMFPNPTSQKLQIISKELFVKNAKVYVVNGLGQVVYQGLMNGSKFELDCSVFAAGIYSVILENNGKNYSEKLIVE